MVGKKITVVTEEVRADRAKEVRAENCEDIAKGVKQKNVFDKTSMCSGAEKPEVGSGVEVLKSAKKVSLHPGHFVQRPRGRALA